MKVVRGVADEDLLCHFLLGSAGDRLRMAFPQHCATFDVGEGECYGTGRYSQWHYSLFLSPIDCIMRFDRYDVKAYVHTLIVIVWCNPSMRESNLVVCQKSSGVNCVGMPKTCYDFRLKYINGTPLGAANPSSGLDFALKIKLRLFSLTTHFAYSLGGSRTPKNLPCPCPCRTFLDAGIA